VRMHPSRRRLGFLPGAGAFLLGAALNGIHYSHRLVLALFAAGGLLILIWLVVIGFDFARSELGFGSGGRLRAAFDMVGTGDRYLQVGIRNEGLTLRDAALNLLVPARLGVVNRVANNGSRLQTGSQFETSEELDPGGPSIYWNETGLQIHGGGNSTLFYFLIGYHPGTYPVRLKLYDDTERPRSLVVNGTFTIPTPTIDPEMRSQTLKTQRRYVDLGRHAVVQALAHGQYWPADQSWLPLANNPRYWPSLDHLGEDAHLCEVLGDAYEESARLTNIVNSRQADARRIQRDDVPERTLATFLHALVLLNMALKDSL
jgi:hypothetical protein